MKAAVEALKQKARESWRLFLAHNKSNAPTQHPEVAENKGYILFKELAVVIFYSNCLSTTPREEVKKPDECARNCVHGLFCMLHRLGEESLHRSQLDALSAVMAYRTFMNGVDKVNQCR